MKIMFYINSIRYGGAERVISNLATVLSERENECIVVTSFQDENEYLLGDKVRRISLFKEKLRCSFLKRNLMLINSLRNCLKEETPDILISFMAEPNFRAIIASLGLKNKTLISIRNDPNKEYPNVYTRIFSKVLFCVSDGIVFQTEESKKWFPKAIQKKSKIILNQVDQDCFNIIYNGERRDIVTAGRLVPQKNHKMLINAFASISNQVKDNLIIYGEGELRNELETLITNLHMEDRILLPGLISNVPDTIKSAKLFVLSSDYEGMPNSLMEAMALGLPCISTDCPCGGPRELFGEALSEQLVPVGKESELANAILKVLHGPKNELEVKFRERSQLFFPERVYMDWENYIQTVVNGR